MHGVKRVAGGVPAEQAAERKKKADMYTKLTGLAFKHKDTLSSAPEAVKLNADILSVNPDCYSLWNYRKQLLTQIIESTSSPAGEGAALDLAAIVRAELAVTQAAIHKNPKSYGSWHHRQWVISQEILRQHVKLEDELVLCGKLLDADERNFHCWNYRRWIAGVCRVSLSAELEYTLKMIKRNFSNYSAWQYRASLITRKHSRPMGAEDEDSMEASLSTRRRSSEDVMEASRITSRHSSVEADDTMPADTGCYATPNNVLLPVDVLRGEMHLLLQALFTEPDDQSAWFYQRWVVDRLRDVLSSGTPEDKANSIHILLAHAKEICELSEVEPTCKWPLLSLAHIAKIIDGSEVPTAGEEPALDSAFAESVRADLPGTVASYYAKAAQLDKMHATCYAVLASRVSK